MEFMGMKNELVNMYVEWMNDYFFKSLLRVLEFI